MNRKVGSRPSGMVIGLLAVIAIAVFVFRGCTGGAPAVPNTGSTGVQQPSGREGQLGRAFATSGVDQNGCPTDRVSEFASSQPIYVGFEQSRVPSGTSIFARLMRDGRAIEDSRAITADRDLASCVWFAFEPGINANGFEPGRYQAELFVNGNRVEMVQFNVRGTGARGGLNSGGQVNRVQLAPMVITDRVSSQGCPAGRITQFNTNQTVYVAYDQSQIPAGTQMFARLLSNGQILEDTRSITADRDLNSCVWFGFEASSMSGLQSGTYEVQVFVNGSQADSGRFTVR